MVQLYQEFIDTLKQCGPAIIADCKKFFFFAYNYMYSVFITNI